MEPATAALIARAAIAAGTNKKCGQGLPLYWQPCAFRSSLPSCATSALLPVEQNITGRQCIWHSMEEAPDGMPADYQAYVRQMQESFAELDAILDDIDGMTEGELCDRYLVKSVFILCISAQTGYGLRRMIIKICRLFCGL